MKRRSRYLAISLIIFTAIGIFAFVPYLHAQSDQAVVKGQKAIVEGSKQMLEGSKKIMAVLEKKGLVDEQVRAANKQMMDGYDLVMKGNGMMTGSTTAQGQEMMKRGAAMILKAHSAMVAAVQNKGMTKVCAIDLHECHFAQQKIEHGALQWYFGATGY